MGVKSHPQLSGAVVGIKVELAERTLLVLLKHHESSLPPSLSSATSDGGGGGRKEQLLGNDVDIQVQFTLVRVLDNVGLRPIRIDIPHPLVNVVSSSSSSEGGDGEDNDGGLYNNALCNVKVCIIVKEALKPWVQEMIARFPSHLGCIKKVLTLTSLRVKHRTYE
jgi:ribosome biogenesis protein UTP30